MGALIRRVGAEGGFASVLRKGEHDAGTILVVLTELGNNPLVYERMPQPNGDRAWTLARRAGPEGKADLEEWLERRGGDDPDLWIVELDIANGERFIPIS